MSLSYIPAFSEFKTRAEVELILKTYPAGTKIRLDSMPNDPDPIPSGSTGVIDYIDDSGSLWVKWDSINRSGVSVIPGHDQFTVI